MPKHRSGIAIMVAAIVLTLAVPGIVRGHWYGPSTYLAKVTPTSVAAGSTATFEVKLELVSGGSKGLLSARIVAPVGVSVIGASAQNKWGSVPTQVSADSVTVNGLWLWKVGQSATVTIEAAIACGTAGSVQWDTIGHSTVLFTHPHASTLPRHPGSQLGTDVSGCSLAFVVGSQPADAAVDTNITSEAGNPLGAPVRVQVLDGNGSPSSQSSVPVTLDIADGTGTPGAQLNGSTTESTNTSGVATFSTLSIDQAGFAYRLTSSAAGLDSTSSAEFDVYGELVQCSGACSATVEEGSTEATVSTTTTAGGTIAASLGVDSLSCDNAANKFYERTSEVLSWEVSGSTSVKKVTFKVDKSAVDKPFWKFQVCFSTPNAAFVNRFGVPIQPDQAGLLPDCDFFGHHQQGLPCVLWRWRDFHGNVYVKFLLGEEDPKGHV
jgi:hypothetical protein